MAARWHQLRLHDQPQRLSTGSTTYSIAATARWVNDTSRATAPGPTTGRRFPSADGSASGAQIQQPLVLQQPP